MTESNRLVMAGEDWFELLEVAVMDLLSEGFALDEVAQEAGGEMGGDEEFGCGPFQKRRRGRVQELDSGPIGMRPFRKVKTATRATAVMKAAHWSLRWVGLLGRQDEPPTRWKTTAILVHSETGTMLGNISAFFTLTRQKICRNCGFLAAPRSTLIRSG
jgi:hypothetical protein